MQDHVPEQALDSQSITGHLYSMIVRDHAMSRKI